MDETKLDEYILLYIVVVVHCWTGIEQLDGYQFNPDPQDTQLDRISDCPKYYIVNWECCAMKSSSEIQIEMGHGTSTEMHADP